MGVPFSASIIGKTQTDGAQIISLGGFDNCSFHQIQAKVSATPTSGALVVEAETPGSGELSLAGVIDLVKGPLFFQWTGFASRIRITPANNLDAGKTYDVYLVSGGRE